VLNSYDSTTFPAAQTGEAGSVCQQQANAGFAGGSNAACYTGTTTSAGLIVFDQGHSIDWSGVTAPSGITTISAALAEEAFICGDAAGNLYKLAWDGSQYVASDIGQTDATGTAADLIRDDRLNELVFGSDSTWQSFKVLNFATILPIDLQPSVQIGIGPLANLSPRYRLLIPTVGLTGGGVYEYSGGGWTLRNNGLPAVTLYGLAVAANPNNSNEWLAVFTTDFNASTSGGSVQVSGGELVGSDGSTGVLWHTSDAGLHWTKVTLSIASVAAGTRIQSRSQIAWTTAGWGIIANTPTIGPSYAFTGTGNTMTSAITINDYRAIYTDRAPDGTLLITTSASSGTEFEDPLIYLSGGSVVLPPGTVGNNALLHFACYPTGNAAVFVVSSIATSPESVWYAADYTAAQPVQKLGSGTGNSVAITRDERVYLGGNVDGPSAPTRTGIAEVLNIAGTASTQQVAFTTTQLGRLSVDKQTRSVIAALNGAKSSVLVWDGTETEISLPTGVSSSNLADYVEVVA
jgi:hypothetical protein